MSSIPRTAGIRNIQRVVFSSELNETANLISSHTRRCEFTTENLSPVYTTTKISFRIILCYSIILSFFSLSLSRVSKKVSFIVPRHQSISEKKTNREKLSFQTTHARDKTPVVSSLIQS